jgi:hypothetical protein
MLTKALVLTGGEADLLSRALEQLNEAEAEESEPSYTACKSYRDNKTLERRINAKQGPRLAGHV